MKWNIDRTLRDFVTGGYAYLHIKCELANPHRLVKEGLRVPIDEGPIMVWVFSFGREGGATKTFYGLTLHDAVLHAKKFVKKASEKTLLSLGVRRPKRTNKFAVRKFKGSSSPQRVRQKQATT